MPGVIKVVLGFYLLVTAVVLSVGCGAPPKSTVPALTPQTAGELLQNSAKAQNWITYVKKQNASCEYQLELPDQSSQPTEIDLTHIVQCGGRPSPKEYDASVIFEYDKATQKWSITRFSS